MTIFASTSAAFQCRAEEEKRGGAPLFSCLFSRNARPVKAGLFPLFHRRNEHFVKVFLREFAEKEREFGNVVHFNAVLECILDI